MTLSNGMSLNIPCSVILTQKHISQVLPYLGIVTYLLVYG